jgi:hypothetical protein
MKLEIIKKDWTKRRTATKALVEPLSADVIDFQLVHNHFCTLVVTYTDGSVKELLARVLYNSLQHTWAIDGMEVAVRVKDIPTYEVLE